MYFEKCNICGGIMDFFDYSKDYHYLKCSKCGYYVIKKNVK